MDPKTSEDVTDRAQARALAAPIPDRFIERKPGASGADYIGHDVITAYLNAIVPDWTFTLVDQIWGPAAEVVTKKGTVPGRDGAIVGGVWRMVATVDGHTRTVDEVGTSEHPAMHHDGENLKLAASDAIKRCAMRLGLGLDLWLDRHAGLGARLIEIPLPALVDGPHSHEDRSRDDMGPSRPSDPTPAPERPTAAEIAARRLNAGKSALLVATGGDTAAASALWDAILADYPGADLTDPATADTLRLAAEGFATAEGEA